MTLAALRLRSVPVFPVVERSQNDHRQYIISLTILTHLSEIIIFPHFLYPDTMWHVYVSVVRWMDIFH